MKRIVGVLTLVFGLLLSSFNVSFADVKEVGKDVPTGCVINGPSNGYTYLYTDDVDLDQSFTITIKDALRIELKRKLLYGMGYKNLILLMEASYYGRSDGNVTVSIKNSESGDDDWSDPTPLTEQISIETNDEYMLPTGTGNKKYNLDIRLQGTLRSLRYMLGYSDYISIGINDVTDSSSLPSVVLDDHYDIGIRVNIYKIIGQSFDDVGYFVETVGCTNITSDKEYPVYGKNIIMYEVGDPHNTGRGLESYKCKYNCIDKYILDHTIWRSWGAMALNF